MLADAILNGQFKMVNASWRYISKEVKKIVRDLLQVDPRDRMTMKKLKQHPWLQGQASTRPVPGLPGRLKTVCSAPI